MFTSFSDHFKALGKSDRTAIEYTKEARYFARFIRQGTDLSDEDLLILATKDDAYQYSLECAKRDLSKATLARKISSLRSFYSFLLEFGFVSSNPFQSVHRPKVSRSLPIYLSLDDARRLIQHSRTGKDLFYRRRDNCIIVLFINTGLRLSELADVDLSDVYDDAVHIIGKGDKERYSYLNQACKKALRLWLSHRGQTPGGLFISKSGNRICASTISAIVKRHIVSAGLDPRMSTHKLRHTCATMLYRYGAADIRLLRDILGHASIATTEIYTHVVDEQIREAMEAHPLAKF